MKASTKHLTLSALLLLGPVSIGWLGVREIGRLEEAVATTVSRGVLAELKNGEQELRAALEDYVTATLDGLAGQPRRSIERALRAMAKPHAGSEREDPTIAGFLLAPNGQPVFPRVPPRSRTVEPTLVPAGGPSAPPEVNQLLNRVRDAEWFAMIEEPEEALGLLEAFAATGAVKPEDELGSARLAYELGRFRMRTHDHAGAFAEYSRARERMAGIAGRQPARAGVQALYLLAQLGEAEAEEHLARAAGTPASDARLRSILAVLEGISQGDFDVLHDEWLQLIYDRAEALAARRAAADIELGASLEELREQNRERVTLRLLAADIRELGLDLTIPRGERIDTYPLYEGGGTTLLAMRALAVGTGDVAQNLWAALQIDLASLYRGRIGSIEERLVRAGQGYAVELVDARGRGVVSGHEVLGEDDEQDSMASLRLRRPLFMFSLVAVPNDPQQLTTSTRRSLLVKSFLLFALALLAGAGAFVIGRTMKRESELANLKTEFVGRVSHELKTPLALIRMYGETLALGRAQDPEKVSQFASIIAKESDRLAAMIDNVLDFSRIEAGNKVYRTVRTRLDLHLDGLLESYRPHLEDHGFVLRWSALPHLSADVDPEGLTQAVVNLLSNARKYAADSDPKEVEVRIERAGREARIEILDRGPGVPPAERERIFETFYRASTAGEHRGVGLGLALVRHFAEHHGGRAEIDARAEGGSVFRIVLPLADEGGGSQPPEPPRKERPA